MKKNHNENATPRQVSRLKKKSAKEARPKDFFGSMRDDIKILGDITSPATEKDEWECSRD